MMKHITYYILLIILSLTWGCGPKINTAPETIKNEAQTYAESINTNSNLKETYTEGALTDINGNEDTGRFKYYTYTSKDTGALYRIKNIEITMHTTAENFYFKDGKLVLITTQVNDTPVKTLYVTKGRVINKDVVRPEYEDILLNKAKMFKRQWRMDN